MANARRTGGDSERDHDNFYLAGPAKLCTILSNNPTLFAPLQTGNINPPCCDLIPTVAVPISTHSNSVDDKTRSRLVMRSVHLLPGRVWLSRITREWNDSPRMIIERHSSRSSRVRVASQMPVYTMLRWFNHTVVLPFLFALGRRISYIISVEIHDATRSWWWIAYGIVIGTVVMT